MILNDLYCRECSYTEKDAWFSPQQMPKCRCGAELREDWSHGKAPATDLGSPRHFDGLDQTFSSTRQAETHAKNIASRWTDEMQASGKNVSWTIEGCNGDKRHGARDVRRVRHSAFSYAGQCSHTSTGERRAS